MNLYNRIKLYIASKRLFYQYLDQYSDFQRIILFDQYQKLQRAKLDQKMNQAFQKLINATLSINKI